MNYPKISIVTPSFNQAEYLEKTILSVLNQGYPDLEYIIIDGGSSDGSVDIIKKYEEHIKYWVSETDYGHGNALNKGFSNSTGEIMAWLNSDDIYYPYTFKAVAEVFESFSDINWIQGKNSVVDASGRLIDFKYSLKNVYSFLTGDYKWIQQESVFWRRKLWEKSGSHISEKMKLMVDNELWSRFFLIDDIWHLDFALSAFRSHESNRSKLQWESVNSEMEFIIDTLRNSLTEENYSSLVALENHLASVLKKNEKEKVLRKLKLLKGLPYFIYTRLMNRIINSHEHEFEVLNESNYDYKLIVRDKNGFTKSSAKFEGLNV
jgi:glycosyltransferase involved in cell wall biosynthesis